MKAWWIRPMVRTAAALALPCAVPAIITGLIWALPGSPAEIICPAETCGGAEELAKRWNLDQGAWHFYTTWIQGALHGDLGRSWRVQPGVSVSDLVGESIANTALLLLLGSLPLLVGAVGGATGWIPRKLDALATLLGLVPAVVFSLLFAAVVELKFGADSFSDAAVWWRLSLGAVVLGLADGAFSGALSGVRGLFDAERKQRYVGVALLRGEGALANMLPNVLPAVIGQLRARLLGLLSGTVIVEVILRIDGVGDLLWLGTLLQDFGVVLAAATVYAVLSSLLLLLQAAAEVGVALFVRQAPALQASAAPVHAVEGA